MANIIKFIQFKRGTKTNLETILQGTKKPLFGEPIWEIDTNKLKIGDGKHNYKDLPYITGESSEQSDLVLNGYYKNKSFYEEEACLTPLTRYVTKLYFDKFKNEIYYYSTDGLFHALIKESQVDSNVPGLVKLYGSTGQNTDGTMSQKAITDNLDKKVELLLSNIGEECIIFNTNNL